MRGAVAKFQEEFSNMLISIEKGDTGYIVGQTNEPSVNINSIESIDKRIAELKAKKSGD
jgi:hypothetical protein